MFRRASTNVTHWPEMNGTQWTYTFANGYGASVVNHDHAYAGVNTFEVAVTHRVGDYPDPEKKSDLCYSTPITNDVFMYLKMREVADILDTIEALPANNYCNHH